MHAVTFATVFLYFPLSLQPLDLVDRPSTTSNARGLHFSFEIHIKVIDSISKNYIIFDKSI